MSYFSWICFVRALKYFQSIRIIIFYVVSISCQYDTKEMHLQFQIIGKLTIDFDFYMNVILPLIFSNWLLNIEECIKKENLDLLLPFFFFFFCLFNGHCFITRASMFTHLFQAESFRFKQRETIKFIFYIKQMKFLK